MGLIANILYDNYNYDKKMERNAAQQEQFNQGFQDNILNKQFTAQDAPYQLSQEEQFTPGEQIEGLYNQGETTGLMSAAIGGNLNAQGEVATGLMQMQGGKEFGQQILGGLFSSGQENQYQMAANQKTNAMQRLVLEDKQMNEMFNRNNAINTQYQKDISTSRQTLQNVKDITQVVTDAGGMDKITGHDSLIMVRKFFDSLAPGANFMNDDNTASILAGGLGGTADYWLNYLTDGGKLGAEQVNNLLLASETMGATAYTQYGEIRNDYGKRAAQGQLNPNDFMRPDIGFKRSGLARKTGGKNEMTKQEKLDQYYKQRNERLKK